MNPTLAGSILWYSTFLFAEGLVDRLFSYLPEFILNSFRGVIEALLDFDISDFIIIDPNPYGSADAAWMNMFEISLALFPIMIILGLLSMPFADEQKTSLWRQGLRIVGVVALIAVSRPIIGFGVDVSNALTLAILPNAGEITSILNPFSGALGVGVLVAGGIGAVVAGPIMLKVALVVFVSFGIVLTLLQLRVFLIYIVYVASPLLIVFWYADWGLLESVNEFANKWFRMGTYTLLSGPIIAIIMLTMIEIASDPVAADNTIAGLWTYMTLLLCFPFIMIAAVWKIVSWAGEPIGAGQAMTGMLMAGGAALGAVSGKLDGAKGEAAGAAGEASEQMGGMGGGGGSSGGSSGSSTTGSGSGGPAGSGSGLDKVMNSQSGETIESSASGPQGGVSGDMPGGTGTDNGGPSDEVTGVASASESSEPKGYIEGGLDRAKDFKDRNKSRISNAVDSVASKTKKGATPTNLERLYGQHKQKKGDKAAENLDQFNDAIDWSQGDNGAINLDQAGEGLEATPQKGQGMSELTEDGRFGYLDEDGELQVSSVGSTRGRLRGERDSNYEQAQAHNEHADELDEKMSHHAKRLQKTRNNINKHGADVAGAFFNEGVKGTVGSHSPYLMAGSGFGGGGGFGSGGGSGGGGVGQATPAGGDSDNPQQHPPANVEASDVTENAQTVAESGQRFDLSDDVDLKASPDPTGDGMAQEFSVHDPETGDQLGNLGVSEQADMRLSNGDTERLSNLTMAEDGDGGYQMVADENSRTFSENEVRVDDIIGNSEMEGEKAKVSNVTLQEDPENAGNYYAQAENGARVPVHAGSEDAGEELSEAVGQSVDLEGVTEQRYGFSEDTHTGYEGAHNYNSLRVGGSGDATAEKSGDSTSEGYGIYEPDTWTSNEKKTSESTASAAEEETVGNTESASSTSPSESSGDGEWSVSPATADSSSGFSTSSNGTGGGSPDDSFGGVSTATETGSKSSGEDSESEVWSPTKQVSGEEVMKANTEDDLPGTVSMEGNWVYSDTTPEGHDSIAKRGIFTEANTDGTPLEDGAEVGYVRFSEDHAMGSDDLPEIDGERRDPTGGEVVSFDSDNGFATRQWATKNPMGDTSIDAERHGGAGETIPMADEYDENDRVNPDDEYMQIVPRNNATSKLHTVEDNGDTSTDSTSGGGGGGSGGDGGSDDSGPAGFDQEASTSESEKSAPVEPDDTTASNGSFDSSSMAVNTPFDFSDETELDSEVPNTDESVFVNESDADDSGGPADEEPTVAGETDSETEEGDSNPFENGGEAFATESAPVPSNVEGDAAEKGVSDGSAGSPNISIADSEEWSERAQNWREHVDESAGETGGFGEGVSVDAGAMRKETLEETGEDIYITDYDTLAEVNGEEKAEQLKTQSLIGHQYTQEMGHEAPNVAYNPEENEVIQQEVGGPDTDTWAVEDAPDGALEKVDREEFDELMGSQLLAGNFDTSPDNIHVDEDGGLFVMDFDRTGDDIGDVSDSAEMEINAATGAATGTHIGEVNDDFHTDKWEYEKEITDSAVEIATELDENGEVDDVLGPVEELEREVSNGDSDRTEVIRSNIDAVAGEDIVSTDGHGNVAEAETSGPEHTIDAPAVEEVGGVDHSEVDFGNLSEENVEEGKEYMLEVEERETLYEELKEAHGEEEVDNLYTRFMMRKRSSKFNSEDVTKQEIVGNEALGTDHPVRDDEVEYEPTEGEIEAHKEYMEASNQFVNENLTDENGQAHVHRGMGYRGNDIAAELIDNPEAEEIDVPEPEQSMAYSTKEEVAQGFSSMENSPVVTRADATEEDVLAVDGLGYEPTEHDFTEFNNQDEGEILVQGKETIPVEDIRFTAEDSYEESHVGERLKKTLESPEEASADDHDLVDYTVRNMAANETTGLKTQEGAERLHNWGTYVDEHEDTVPSPGITTHSVNSVLEQSEADVGEVGSGSHSEDDGGAEIL